MAAELTGTNAVHRFVLGKAHGYAEFCGSEAALLAGTLMGLWLGLGAPVAIVGVALCAVALHLLRRADNGRREHLELRLRSALMRRRRYRLIEPDGQWTPLGARIERTSHDRASRKTPRLMGLG